MNSLFSLVALLLLVSSSALAKAPKKPIKDPSAVYTQVQNDLAQTYCPYSGFLGSNYCPVQSYSDGRLQDGNMKLPGMLGLTWNPMTRKLGLPVLQFTYTGSSVWKSTNGTIYQVPNEVSLTPIPHTVGSRQISTYHNEFEYQKNILVFNPNAAATDVWGGLYSHSQSMQSLYMNLFGDGQSSTTVLQEKWSSYRLTLKTFKLAPRFVDALNMLPQAYDQDMYFEFLDFFPAYVAYRAEFGGMLEQQTIVRRCAYNSLSDATLLDEANIDFQKTLDPNFVPDHQRNQQYVDSAQVGTLDIYGGDPTLFQPADMNARILSFEINPIMSYFQFIPLTTVLKQVQWPNQWLIDNMNKAVTDYFNGQLQQLNNDAAQIAQLEQQAFMQPKGISMNVMPNFNMCLNCMQCIGGCPYKFEQSLAPGASFAWTGSWTCQKNNCNADGSSKCVRDPSDGQMYAVEGSSIGPKVDHGCSKAGSTTCCFIC